MEELYRLVFDCMHNKEFKYVFTKKFNGEYMFLKHFLNELKVFGHIETLLPDKTDYIRNDNGQLSEIIEDITARYKKS